MEAQLEAARLRYNELYPDRPITKIGDTAERYYYLVLMSDTWLNGEPLSGPQINAVEMMTPAGMFS